MLGHDRGDEEGIPDIVKAFSPGSFLREKILRERFGHPEQILQGGGVFGAVQTAQAALAGVFHPAAAQEGFVVGDPRQKLLFLLRGGLVLFGWRHLAGLHLVFGAPPQPHRGTGVRKIFQGRQIDPAFLALRIVAIDAVGFQHGPDLLTPMRFGGSCEGPTLQQKNKEKR